LKVQVSDGQIGHWRRKQEVTLIGLRTKVEGWKCAARSFTNQSERGAGWELVKLELESRSTLILDRTFKSVTV